jgi:hypothetical protein
VRRLTVFDFVRIALVAPLILLIGGPRTGLLQPVYHEQIAITSQPIALQPDVPDRSRTGQLTLLGGWKLEAKRSRQFGGWSALRIAGDQFFVIGDYGSVLRFRLTPYGRAVDARIDPLPIGCGRQDDKRLRDSESLARAASGWWIGYEVDNRLCMVSRDFTRAQSLRRPQEMSEWRKKFGAETLLRLADGRFLAIAERGLTDDALRPLLMFSGDPGDPRSRVSTYTYAPPPGYSPTDAAQLPDGRILVLNRKFSLATLFTSALVVIDPTAINSAAPVTGSVIARLKSPTVHDNFEGVEVSVERGRPIIWIMSDDNFMTWQATYLLKFALDPLPGSTERRP